MKLIDANALKRKLQEHHDFFVNAYGGFKNLPPNDKARVDEITHCISEVVNAPTVELFCAYLSDGEVRQPCVEAPCKYERPQGEWIFRTDTEWHFECNQCKGLSPWKAQFCGVCGADMRKGGAE